MHSIVVLRRVIGSVLSVPTTTTRSGSYVGLDLLRQPVPTTGPWSKWALAKFARGCPLRWALLPQCALPHQWEQPLLQESSRVLGKPRNTHPRTHSLPVQRVPPHHLLPQHPSPKAQSKDSGWPQGAIAEGRQSECLARVRIGSELREVDLLIAWLICCKS